jgi:hypothetical protein
LRGLDAKKCFLSLFNVFFQREREDTPSPCPYYLMQDLFMDILITGLLASARTFLKIGQEELENQNLITISQS